ncbi:laminin subunit beta-1 isoform X1 [Hydra vulgaris]|uniref:laminin subunit beta-1 isoform X1 n=1 Tax=Hydra vulgaris TaxID=6087 RepID=UPI001F5EE051|nr:laminin subunit beta-1 [Hydra vulgaris]
MNGRTQNLWFSTFRLVIVYALFFAKLCFGQEECLRGGCYPATGDLLVGRENRITATSTCGLKERTKYCIVSFLEKDEKCFWCHSTPEIESSGNRYKYSHLPKYMVTQVPADRLKGWWQAENGVENVTIQVDFEAEFVFTHLIMTFKTFRPKAMYIERSLDYGKTYSVYRYFAYNCAQSFPNIPTGTQHNIDDVVCEERYSKVEPSTLGEVVMKVLDPTVQKEQDPYSLSVQRLLKLTNLRIRFTELHTFGDIVLGNSGTKSTNYYYALYELVVRGSCSCYGHAEHCIPSPDAPTNVNMVHGMCNCTHNTQGKNCQECKDGYNDLPWQPSYKDKLSVCKKCNCNGHSDKCHFDIAVYNANGKTSGGVCDDCQHNTHGRQCEQCKPLYYRDPFKNIFDPDVCKQCDCDPSGSIGRGECETVSSVVKLGSEEHLSSIPGKCICKSNVEGKRCDQCKNGFWNLLESKSEGCQSCNCDERGSVEINKCDQQTGICRCKRNVQGFTCSKCMDGFWALGSTKEGCQKCGCDVGGSVSSVCDDISGSCQCKRNIIGRQCNLVQTGYYVEDLSHNKYEGEDSVPGEVDTPFNVRKIIVNEGDNITWTGEGGVGVKEGSVIEFSTVRVPSTGSYKIYIRYDAKNHGKWRDVVVTVKRKDGRELGGDGCAVINDNKVLYYPILSEFKMNEALTNDICFVKGVVYDVQVNFIKNLGEPDGETFVDSIVLIPNVDDFDVMEGQDGAYYKDLWEKNNCLDYYLNPVLEKQVPDVCKKIQFSISTQLNNGASSCDCDVQGTVSTGLSEKLTCESIGGQCPCKPGVIGRRCDRCKTGYYGFGSEGCKACNCSRVGSKNLLCDDFTGECLCKEGLEGRTCNSCPKNHFGFPDCKPCKCYGHSSTCDAATGVCNNCLHNTKGTNCQLCKDGYYGNALLGTENACQRCQCPGGSSGNQFSNTCELRDVGKVFCTNCSEGFTGTQCEKCDNGYYGNPLIQGGTCKKCLCNGNINSASTPKCDSATGKCFNCLNNAFGDFCETCKPGFYGNASKQSCKACECNSLGTNNNTGGYCNSVSGQCPCLPNVVGMNCDKCADGFYEMIIGKGCRNCMCDLEGSLDGTCDKTNGQCKCRVGFGGQFCSECENYSWGMPKTIKGCKACNCNPAGSADLQCNRTSGVCKCKPNVVGEKCDMCAPRTSGKMPTCSNCHTCNDQWEDIINELEIKILNLKRLIGNVTFNASEISSYNQDIEELNDRLIDIENYMKNISLTAQEVDALRTKHTAFKLLLDGLALKADNLSVVVANNTQRLQYDNIELDMLELRMGSLKKDAKDFRENVTTLQEGNIEGGFNSTLDSQRRSREAQQLINVTDDIISKSKVTRRKIKNTIISPKNDKSFEKLDKDNNKLLDNLTEYISLLELKLKALNAILCGSKENTSCGCDRISCISCNCDGLRNMVDIAFTDAKQAAFVTEEKKVAVNHMVENLKVVQALALSSKEAASSASKSSNEAKRIAENAVNNITSLIQEILIFLNSSTNHPNISRALSLETIKLNISLTPDDVKELADQIRQVVTNLTDVDRILNESKKDYDRAIDLKNKAMDIKKYALYVVNKTQTVLDQLSEAALLQNYTASNISIGYIKHKEATDLIIEIEKLLAETEGALDVSLNKTNKLENKRKRILVMFEKNKQNLRKAEIEAENAKEVGQDVAESSEELSKNYQKADEKLKIKVNETKNLRDRVQALLDNAVKLFENADKQMKKIDILKTIYKKNQDLVEDLSKELRILEIKAKYTRDRLIVLDKWHGGCNPDLSVKVDPNLAGVKVQFIKDLKDAGGCDNNICQ